MPEDATVRGSLHSMDQPLMNCCSTRPNAPNWDSFAQDGRGPFPLPAGLGRLVRKGFSATSGRQGLRHEAEANLCASGGSRSRSLGCVRPCRARLRKGTRTQRKRTWCPPQRTPCRQERLVATEFGVGFPRCRQRACWPSRRGRSAGPPPFADADHGLTKSHRSVRQGDGQLPRWQWPAAEAIPLATARCPFSH